MTGSITRLVDSRQVGSIAAEDGHEYAFNECCGVSRNTRNARVAVGLTKGQAEVNQSVADMVAFVTPVLRDPLRADGTELIVDPRAEHDPRQGSNDDDNTATSDQYRYEHGTASIWRTCEDFKSGGGSTSGLRPPARIIAAIDRQFEEEHGHAAVWPSRKCRAAARPMGLSRPPAP
jgi:hypothetical protein